MSDTKTLKKAYKWLVNEARMCNDMLTYRAQKPILQEQGADVAFAEVKGSPQLLQFCRKKGRVPIWDIPDYYDLKPSVEA